MKRFFPLLLVITVLLTSSNPAHLVELTLVNKSERAVAFQLTGLIDLDENILYYLPVPEGNRVNPTSKTYWIVQDLYSIQLFYMQTYDPVYGWPCVPASTATQLFIKQNTRIVVFRCGERPTNRGEKPTMLKMGSYRVGIPVIWPPRPCSGPRIPFILASSPLPFLMRY
jgi:hypothetical protein